MDAVPIAVDFAPELEEAITPSDTTKEFSVPEDFQGELIIEVVDDDGVKWRYAFIALPRLIAHTSANESELEFARRASELRDEVLGGRTE